MKNIKRILKFIAVLVLFIICVLLISLSINSCKTRYLKIDESLSLNSFVISNVNVITMTKDTVLKNKMVYVKDGIIVEINDQIRIKNVTTIDGENKFLSPGLIDMHVHLWDKQELGLYLANGVTTVRNLWGYPMHLRIKKAINNEELIGPMLLVSSPKLTSSDDFGGDKVQIENPKKAKELVNQYKSRGYDFIKTYAGISDDIMSAVIEQSIVSNISVVAHPSYKIPYLDQFNDQISTIEHAEEIVQQPLNYSLDSLKLNTIIKKFVSTNKSFTPTLIGYYKIFEILKEGDRVLESELYKYLNPLIQSVDSKNQLNRWTNEKEQNIDITTSIHKQHKFHLYILSEMNKAGVNIVCGTDAGIGITAPGYSIHEELALYKEAGLSNFEALKTATINPSKTHFKFKKMGSIVPGNFANFILSTQNPLINLNTLSHPEWVMIEGRKLEKERLEMYTEKAYDRNNLISTALSYAEYLIVEK